MMYETIGKFWEEYRNKYSGQWERNDPRHNLSAEISNRLEQLDLILDHPKQALSRTTDADRSKRDLEWFKQAQPRFARGEITQEEYLAGFSPPPQGDVRLGEVWSGKASSLPILGGD